MDDNGACQTGNTKRAWELMNLVNPINHAATEEKMLVYKAEPYVAAADVYSVSPNNGRGGWTWYTGSAGWMYQLIIEWLLGIQLEGNILTLSPCVPAEWSSFNIKYMYRGTRYDINVKQGSAQSEQVLKIDGVVSDGNIIVLSDDGAEHNIEVLMKQE